jgi:nucleotide sugar dehydrogenase
MSMKVGIVGGGVVGVNDALLLASNGYEVVVVDTNPNRVACINKVDYTSCPWLPTGFQSFSDKIEATTSYDRLSDVNVVFIDVNTPLRVYGDRLVSMLKDNNRNLEDYIDLQPLRHAIKSLVKVLPKQALVIVRTTLCLDCFHGEIIRSLEAHGLSLGSTVYAVYVPERLDLGNPINYRSIPRLIGHVDPMSAKRATRLFNGLGVKTHHAYIREVELAKLYENAFRLVNIALAQEALMRIAINNIDFLSVIKLASTKPYGFMKFYPGPYAGGHCLVKDAVMYWIATGSEIVKRAIIVNEETPHWYAGRLCSFFKKRSIRRVLFHGCGYKPGAPLMSTPDLNPIQRIIREVGMRCPDVDVRVYDEAILECRDFGSLSEGREWADIVIRWSYDDLVNLLSGAMYSSSVGGWDASLKSTML